MNDPEYVMRRIPRAATSNENEHAFGVFDIHFTNPHGSQRDDWGQCLGVLFTDDVELEAHEDKPYALWIKKTRITEDKEIELVWDTKPLMRGTAQDVPDLTTWLYNWALLGGYKERQ